MNRPTRFRIVATPGYEPPYVLEPDPQGIVCLADAVTTALEAQPRREAVGDIIEVVFTEAAVAHGKQRGIRAAAAWLRKKGLPNTADALLEELLP